MITGKKGLSTVVTTLIMVLLVLAAVGIIWVPVKNLLSTNTNSLDQTKCFSVNYQVLKVNATSGNLYNVTLKRSDTGGGIGEVGAKVIFYNDVGSSGTLDFGKMFGALEVQTSSLDAGFSDANSVEVAPYYIDQATGEEKICTNSATLDFRRIEGRGGPGVVCGNGILESGEQCDYGANNGVACTPLYGEECDYCSTSCQFVNVPGGNCGDGTCEPPVETELNCPSDCGTVSSGLVIELSFENNVQDSSGNNNHGTLVGATYVTGVSGQAISFDGAGDYVRIPYAGNLPQGSVAFWLKSSGSTGNTQIFFEGDGAAYASSPGFEGNGTKFYFHLNGGIYTIPTTYSSGTWIHFVGTWDGSVCKLYKNGELVSSLSCGAGENGITHFYVGGRLSSYSYYGLMDELKVYNRALSLSEVESLM